MLKIQDKRFYKGFRVLLVSNDNMVYASKKNAIFVSCDFGETWQFDGIVPCNLFHKIFSANRKIARFFRFGIHGLVKLSDGTKICIIRKGIYRVSPGETIYKKTFHVKRGSRPLNLCLGRDEELFWGEYFDNPNRDTVNIYSSYDNGKTWQICYSFPNKSIRHIHGVYYDKYDDCYWIVTGDYGLECAIFRTKDKFKTIETVRRGGQQNRCLSLQIERDFIVYATDTPLEKNFIYLLDKRTGSVIKSQEIHSTGFYSCRVGNNIFFSTAIEPSLVNKTKISYIWTSSNGREWTVVDKYKKDYLPMNLFQFGQIFFPYGNNSSNYLFFSGVALENIDECIVRLKLK